MTAPSQPNATAQARWRVALYPNRLVALAYVLLFLLMGTVPAWLVVLHAEPWPWLLVTVVCGCFLVPFLYWVLTPLPLVGVDRDGLVFHSWLFEHGAVRWNDMEALSITATRIRWTTTVHIVIILVPAVRAAYGNHTSVNFDLDRLFLHGTTTQLVTYLQGRLQQRLQVADLERPPTRRSRKRTVHRFAHRPRI